MGIDFGSILDRRVAVENYLLECSADKRPPPNADTCRILALRLGTPKDYWSEELLKELP